MTAATRDLRWVWFAAEVMLVITSITTMLMLGRLFEDTAFLSPLVFTLLVSHGVLISMRWFGFGIAASGVVSFLATAAAVVAIHYSDSAIAAVVPTSATIEQFQLDMTQARDLFQTLQAPVPGAVGFLVIASLAMWCISFAADWAAFRLFAPGQAMIPFFGLLLFVALLGVEQDRVRSTGIALGAAVLFLLAHRAASRAAQGIWLDDGPSRGYRSIMAAGAVVAVVAAGVGVIGGPAVPGADEEALLEIGSDSRREKKPLEVISPLVQIQPRLVNQSDQVLFTVETNQRAYWRIAALDVFDGSLWRSQGQFRSAGDDLGVGYPSGAPVAVVEQTFDLGSLNVVWAPAAYLPIEFENLSGSGVNYEAESATFIVDTNDQQVSDGLRYRVQSQIPSFTPELLRTLGRSSSDTADSRYLDLPADYSPLAKATAEQLTLGLDDPYDQALALQNWFRDNFTYDINVAKGHDIDRLEDFLAVQRGYCEQFAGTFASMARSIGLPARVATGFTPGDPDPNNPNRYLVRGRHAHAWPEVFIAGAGWVAFEPTPGRGAPNASQYTGVPESQASNQVDANGNNSEETAAAQPVPVPEPEQFAPEPTPTPIAQTPEEEAAAAEALEPDVAPSAGRGLPRSVQYLLLAIAVLAAWFFGVPALKRWRDRRRRERFADDARRRVTLAWAAAVDSLEAHSHPPVGAETLDEYHERVVRLRPTIDPAFGELTTLTVRAAYQSEPPTDEEAERAEQYAVDVARALEAGQPWPVTAAIGMDPRPLLRWRDPIIERADRLASGATAVAASD